MQKRAGKGKLASSAQHIRMVTIEGILDGVCAGPSQACSLEEKDLPKFKMNRPAAGVDLLEYAAKGLFREPRDAQAAVRALDAWRKAHLPGVVEQKHEEWRDSSVGAEVGLVLVLTRPWTNQHRHRAPKFAAVSANGTAVPVRGLALGAQPKAQQRSKGKGRAAGPACRSSGAAALRGVRPGASSSGMDTTVLD